MNAAQIMVRGCLLHQIAVAEEAMAHDTSPEFWEGYLFAKRQELSRHIAVYGPDEEE